MKRLVACGAVVGLLSLALPPGIGGTAAASRCGLTTLDGVVEFSPESVEAGEPLKCGPGQKLVLRENLAQAKAGRSQRRRPLTSFVTIADIQLADEESPLRAEWADKCEEHPATAAFRPHETLVPALMNAHVKAASRIIASGSPVLDDSVDFAIGLGDLADNNQYNEIRWVIDIFDGRQLVNPDSGDDGYHGVQATDPEGAHSHPLTSPVEGLSLRELGNEPFWAHGLRRAGGGPFPWYSIPGNHDVKVQGTVTNTENWRSTADAWARGNVKFTDVSPDQQQRACEGGAADPDYYTDLFSNPGGAQVVPADDDRRLLPRHRWAREHFHTSGVPVGHGFDKKRCRDKEGKLLARLCYSWTQGDFHYIGLDSNPDEGLENGNIDRPQWRWLKKELRRSSSFNYKANGKVARRRARDRMIVVFSHHPTTSMDNTSTPGGKNSQQMKRLLLRFPNVILHSAGHTHQNKIWARRSKELGTKYWEVNTAAIVDVPHQSRTIEVADNRDGTISIFAVVFDALAGPNARLMDWADDPTSERSLAGADRDINEDWLASAAREIGIFDPQQDLMKVGRPRDRNVELLLKAPRWLE